MESPVSTWTNPFTKWKAIQMWHFRFFLHIINALAQQIWKILKRQREAVPEQLEASENLLLTQLLYTKPKYNQFHEYYESLFVMHTAHGTVLLHVRINKQRVKKSGSKLLQCLREVNKIQHDDAWWSNRRVKHTIKEYINCIISIREVPTLHEHISARNNTYMIEIWVWPSQSK